MINIDDIVFEQTQLDDAIERGCRNICLCDNSFTLPCTDGVSYMAIGDVKAVIRLDKGKRYNIGFNGFEPTIIYTGGYTGITEKTGEEILPLGGSYTSFGSGSYGSGSYQFSEYEWESGSYVTSGSAAGSYATSYTTSYVTSYTTSGSALIALRELYHAETAENVRRVFYAAGYGLNLI